MQAEIDKLIGTLRTLVEQHRELLIVIKSKRDALIAYKMEDILRFTAEEEKLADTIRLLDGERRRLILNIQRKYWRKPEVLTLNKLIAYIPYPNQQEDLKNLRAKLAKAIEEIAAVNQVNKTLSHQSLEHLGFILRVLQGGEGTTIYTFKGKHAEITRTQRLDQIA